MKLFFNALLILIIISTISICITQPSIHKNIMVYDYSYTITPTQEIVTETKEIPTIEQPKKNTATTVQSIEKKVPITQNQVKTTSAKTYNTNTSKQNVQKVVTKIPNANANTQSVPQNTIKTIETSKTQIKQEPITKEVKQTVTQPVEQVRTITKEEELIAWNVWRSNLQNQIMKDVNLPTIPTGTIFKFSMSVDKYGKISNVHTYALPSNYTPYAVQYIAPVLRGYQGHSILNFPNGSSRVTTDFSGSLKISTNSKYSTPQDYNDVEKVIK